MTTLKPPIDRSALLLPDKVHHLLSGGEAPIPRSTLDAYRLYAEAKASGHSGRAALEATHESVREALGRFLGMGDGQSIAFLASMSSALSTAIGAIDWRAGDRIVVLSDEFPSVVLACRQAAMRGVEIRVVDPEDDPASAILSAADHRTRLACISHVSYLHGRRIDVSELSSRLHAKGVALALDVSHSLGVLEVNAAACDIVVSCGHKFLLGSHGTGILVWNETRLGRPYPSIAGWFSIDGYNARSGALAFEPRMGGRAFEAGNPDYPSLYALQSGLNLLDQSGLPAIESHALALSDELHRRLVSAGWQVSTPLEMERRGTSIAVQMERSVEAAACLAAMDIMVASGEGRLRLSVHGFNDIGDITAAVDALSRLGASK